ncbi:nitrogen permease regulator 2 [Pyronema domesticum]|uniref:Similar to Nitrogen permease regulator 2 homolog acc. no. O42857 n=1 Tax=Pyronema omphalodes (strain CBS 100304) TaxID=1076935 RepID=U4L1J0_PYROM|nr:nitrogen permease regulator 2 [Pyronema domesticum]CCX05969.1 Similar to Nitrogen permease regulator 2 homolog; acc. no. O42857 [Pyronema omphalodes CBS 100304]
MIKSIFFSIFHPDKGPQVVHQVPDGAITPSSAPHDPPPLIDFDQVSSHIIPKQELCDRLVTICTNKYRILGYPVCIDDRRYTRNEFIFNFAILLDESDEFSTYKSVVRKLAKLFKALEEQSGFLSTEETRAGVYALIEQVLEDLNNYSECLIPINESNTISIKLFPTYAPPPAVKPWFVPVSTVQLDLIMDVTWDLTMQKIVPYIDGINSVRRISELADADPNLTKKAISHLLYYGCLTLVDVFLFHAIYAVTADISTLLRDRQMQDECINYIKRTDSAVIKFPDVFTLFCSLSQGLSLKKWCMEHHRMLRDIDVRRFITFGVIKGIIYRVQKYPVAQQNRVPTKLQALVKGDRCFDEICTELQVSEMDVIKMLEGSDATIIHR